MPLNTFVCWLLLIWSLGWLALPLARRIWTVASPPIPKPATSKRSSKSSFKSSIPKAPEDELSQIESTPPSLLLPDGGLAAGRMLCLVVWTLTAFWLGQFGVPTRYSALLIYGFALGMGWLWWRERIALKALIARQRRGLIASELIFLTVFACFFIMRGFWPDLGNGEKPMDNALIAACARADYLPPPNPYAAGERLGSYYYLGHFQTALLTNAIGAQPRWTYNLMAATLPALCFSLLASLAGALTGRVKHGAWVAFFVLACGTEEAWRQWYIRWNDARHGGPPFGWWPINYWDTSRVIPFWDKGDPHFTINEYPWFTFNYGDLHAHYFSQPLALLILALGWALFRHAQGRFQQGKPGRKWKVIALLGAFALGAQIMTNTWDVPAYGLLLTLCLISLMLGAGGKLESRSVGPQRESHLTKGIPLPTAIITAMAAGIIALLVASPFLIRLHSEANPPRHLEQPASPLPEWLIVWGLFSGAWLIVLAAYELRKVREGGQGLRLVDFWPILLLAFILVVSRVVFGQFCLVLSLQLALISWTLVSSVTTDDTTHAFLCRVALCGLLALLWSETTWAGFLDKPFHRQDTVFKFGLQAWYLLGTAGLCGAVRLWHRWMEKPSLWQPFACAAVILIFLAPVAATFATALARTRARLVSRGEVKALRETIYAPQATRPVVISMGTFGICAEQWAGWDAWLHLTSAERDAAQWLQNQARDGDNLLEAEQKQGGDYTEYTRYAHATGIPAMIGPQAHTFQWGLKWEDVFARKADARAFYLSGSVHQKTLRDELVKKYKIRFAINGELERREYGEKNLAWLERELIQEGVANTTFQNGDGDVHRVTIFQLSP